MRPIHAGDEYRLQTKSSLKGYLELPPEKEAKAGKRITINGNSEVVFRERAVREDANGQVDQVLRLYDKVEFKRKLADQDQEGTLRDAVHRIVLQTKDDTDIPYSLDGPLQWTEIDLIRTHTSVASINGLLPNGEVTVGSQWEATERAARDLSGLEPLDSGRLQCTYRGTIEHEGRLLGQIAFSGVLRGRTVDGPVKDAINGAMYVDVGTGRVASLRAIGERTVLDKDSKDIGELDVDYQVVVSYTPNDPELSDAVIRQIPPQPSDELTSLVLEHPLLGVRILHPRRWIMETVDGRDVYFRRGKNSLVLHVEETGKSPTPDQYEQQVGEYMKKEKIVATPVGKLRAVTSDAGTLGNFRLSATLKGEPRILDYWVVSRGNQGATLAAQLIDEDLQHSLGDVEQIVRQIEFIPPALPADQAPKGTNIPSQAGSNGPPPTGSSVPPPAEGKTAPAPGGS